MGELYALIGAWLEVIESMDRMKSIPQASPYHLLGAAKLISQALLARGDPDGALAYNREVLARADLPKTLKFSTYDSTARIHESRGDLPKAICTFQELKAFIRSLGPLDGRGRYDSPDGTGKQIWEYVSACMQISRLRQKVQEAGI